MLNVVHFHEMICYISNQLSLKVFFFNLDLVDLNKIKLLKDKEKIARLRTVRFSIIVILGK